MRFGENKITLKNGAGKWPEKIYIPLSYIFYPKKNSNQP